MPTAPAGWFVAPIDVKLPPGPMLNASIAFAPTSTTYRKRPSLLTAASRRGVEVAERPPSR